MDGVDISSLLRTVELEHLRLRRENLLLQEQISNLHGISGGSVQDIGPIPHTTSDQPDLKTANIDATSSLVDVCGRASTGTGSSSSRVHDLKSSVVADIMRSDSSLSFHSLWSVGVYKFSVKASMRVLHNRFFETGMGIIILLNSILLGVESELKLNGSSPAMLSTINDAESVFSAIYIVELLIRVLAMGWPVFRDGWFIIDFVLIFVGCAYTWLIALLFKDAITDGDAAGGMMQHILIFRTLRLLRLVRALRTLPGVKVAWRLVYGLLTSTSTMLSTLGLVVMVLYIFACLAAELISGDVNLRSSSPELERIIGSNFGSIPVIMMTLVQFVTMDSIASVYFPLVVAKPILILLFMPILLIVSISLMNLVTAVLVDGAMSQSWGDRQSQKAAMTKRVRELVPSFKALFAKMDVDHSGLIDHSDIENLDPSDTAEILKEFKVGSVMELFEVMDHEGTKDVSEHEFVEALLNLALAEFLHVPAETMLLLQLMRTTRKRSQDLQKRVEDLHAAFANLWLGLSQHQSSCTDSQHVGREGVASMHEPPSAARPKHSL